MSASNQSATIGQIHAGSFEQGILNRIKKLESQLDFYNLPENWHSGIAYSIMDEIKALHQELDLYNFNKLEHNHAAVAPSQTQNNDMNIDGSGESAVITGTRRNDVLYGSLGHNIFYGGLGDDTYHVTNADDVIVENKNSGTDTVYSSFTYTAPANVENLTLTGSGNIYGFGNNSNNILTGNSGHNRLSGGRGNDVLYGMGGNDLLLGGDGGDELYGGEGNDILRGDNGNDCLDGGNGDDTLEGGAGADIMRGGSGNDIYYVDNIGDTVLEESNGGNDTIYTSVTYTAPANVENLTLTGSGNIYGFGNNSNNILTGNRGHNRLSGGRGNDVLYGMGGNDLLLGGDGEDKLYGGEGNDILRGGNGNDYLDGGSGSNTLEGGAGNDVYFFGANSGSNILRDKEGRNTVRFESGILPEHLALNIRANADNPGLNDWVVTMKSSGATLTIADQEGGKSTAVSAFEFDGITLSPSKLLETAQPDLARDAVTTRILYPDNTVQTLISANGEAFQTAFLKYSKHSPLENTANGIVLPNPFKVKYSAYGRDTDGDGLPDAIDRNPEQWNVSERDLRMFASLAYEAPDNLRTVFNTSWGKYSVAASNINKEYFLNQAGVGELSDKWMLLKAESSGSGLDYAVFGNGKNADGSYDNVVVAFRGSTDFSDWTANAKIALNAAPNQTLYLDDIARYVDSLNPKNVYSTGHSLGGYLAQYFAAYTMQQNTDRQNGFKHSSLFNPALINADSSASNALKTAAANTNKMVNQQVVNQGDITESKYINKTNSYVIDGEWVSSIQPIANNTVSGAKTGAKIGFWSGLGLGLFGLVTGGAGLAAAAAITATATVTGAKVGAATGAISGVFADGKYPNTVLFNMDGNPKEKHQMINFYGNSSQMEKYFSQGSRIDKHYDNPYLKDSDRDGFSDGIEAKMGTDANSGTSTPYATGTSQTHTDERPVYAIVQTEDGNGNITAATAVELKPVRQGGELVYLPSGDETDLETNGFDWSAFENQAAGSGTVVLYGTTGSDVLKGSGGSDLLWGNLGNDTIIGGEGRDTIVFTARDVRSGSTDRIVGFNSAEDRLDLGGMKSLFADRGHDFKWSDLLVNDTALFEYGKSYLYFNTAEQTLAYRAAGADTGTVFARFDNEQAISLGAAHIIG